MRTFIDKHRDTYGVEPICKVLQIAPSGYRRYAAQRRDPARRCARARRDEALVPHIKRVWQAIGYIPPAEAEANYYRQTTEQAIPA